MLFWHVTTVNAADGFFHACIDRQSNSYIESLISMYEFSVF